MNVIVSVDQKWGIGREGRLLCPISEDLKRFKAYTLGNVVVLGRLTLATFPKQQPLPGRDNVILSRDRSYAVSGAVVVHDLPELFQHLLPYTEEQIYIIGGAQVYQLLLPYCHRAYVTRLEEDFHADRFFPDLEADAGWRLVDRSPRQEQEGIGYCFCTYVQDAPAPWR